MSDNLPAESRSEFILYQSEDGQTRLQVRLQEDTVWLTQKQLADLYQVSVPNVSMHVRNIYAEGELLPQATVKQYLTVQVEGDREVPRTLDHYNLDMVLAIGYRVRSLRGTQFRRWATHAHARAHVRACTRNRRRKTA